MVKINFKRLAALCLGIISLIVCIFYSGLISKPGTDYTEAYVVYNDLKELSSIQDVESYLDNKNIAYEVEESKLTLPACDSIVYIINPDNETGYLKHSIIMHNISKLDERNLDIVDVKKEVVNDIFVEEIYLEKDGFLYTKLEDKYYVEPILWYAIILIASFIISIIVLPTIIVEYIGVFFDWLKERKDKKNLTNKDTDINSETENCEVS